MRPDRRRFWSRLMEWTLVAAGVVCLSLYVSLSRRSAQMESDNRTAVTRMLEPSAPEPSIPEDVTLIGALEIPRLRVSAAIRAGDGPDVLAGAVGHLPDTALPWEQGNTTFAAHRDRLFRPLAGVRAGDEIRVRTRHGDFEYRVSRTFVVDPGDVWVLEPTDGVDLTLVTCYPFGYVGHAPKRFVVRARKVKG